MALALCHDDDVLAAFTADAPLRSVAVDLAQGVILAGDASGNVHVLRPNAALRRLMAGE